MASPHQREAVPIVVMGASGCGKSTLAHALASDTGRPFIEGDEHHPPTNIATMRSGVALTDPERMPFLDSIGRAIREAPLPPVVSCSALRRAHRERLRRHAPDILFVWIDVPAPELERRVERRTGHFMPPTLVPDQLAALEPPTPPETFLRIDGTQPTADQARAVLLHLEKMAAGPA